MPQHLRSILILAAILAPAAVAGTVPTHPSFEPVTADKPRTGDVEITPSPVVYGLEASIGTDGRIAIRCRAEESATYSRWRAALDARDRDGVER